MTVQHAISKAWHLLDVGPVGFTALLHLHRCAVLLVQLSLILGGAACYIKSFQCAGPKLNIAAEHSRLTLTLVTLFQASAFSRLGRLHLSQGWDLEPRLRINSGGFMVVKRCQDKRIIYMCVFDIYAYHCIVCNSISYHVIIFPEVVHL